MDVPISPLTRQLDRAAASSWGGWSRRARPPATLLRRLRSMSLPEIAYRGWQEASKALERVVPATGIVDTERWLSRRAPDVARAETALDLFRNRVPARFFAGVAEPETVPTLIARFPNARTEIIAAADARLTRRFDLLGYRDLDFGDPIDWHVDPIWSRRAPRDHWSRIDPLDPSVVGDSKIVWELNRHQWLVTLAQAFVLTREPRYARACIDAIDSWREANPPGVGVNWSSSLEVSYRLISWCWAVLLLRDAPHVTGPWTMTLLVSIWQHATHIRRYLSYYSSPNTHLTGEALGLMYAGLLFPEYRDADEWRRVATRVLLGQRRAQLLDDGVHFEQSTCYHRYTVDIYLHTLILSARNGISLPPELTTQVAHMVDFLAAVRRPDGTIPDIGDADGGTLLPLATRAQTDARGTFAVAAAVLGRADFAWAAEGAAPEVLWQLGSAGLQTFDALRPHPPSGDPSRLFPSGGYAIMRSGWEADAHQMIVDVGPLGCSTSSGHGHADLLSVQASFFGEPCLVDAGTYCYTAEPTWRDFFRSTAAHSTLVVDGCDQAQPAGPFRWHERPRATLRSFRTDVSLEVLDANHGAYEALSEPVGCRRRVVFVKPHYWVIVDDVGGVSTHQVEVAFQCALATTVTLGPGRWARVATPRGRALWMLPLAGAPIEARVMRGELQPTRGWVSANYGQREPAPMLTFSSTAVMPQRIVTVLVPDVDGSSTPPTVTPMHDDSGNLIGVRCEAPFRSVRFDDSTVTLDDLSVSR